jgi:broad specificity phosphatase PhoE
MADNWPIDIILVRHGQSEGNLAQKQSKKGDSTLWSEEFHKRHTSRYRLTDLGREQAIAAGKWIKENISENFDSYYCSEYVRAKETASLLGFDGAEWLSEFYLREQDMGVLANLSTNERKEKYSHEINRKHLDAFYFAPSGGESIASCCIRIERWLQDIRVNCPGFRIVCVCHGNILKSLRIRLERMSQENWHLLDTDEYKTNNCQVIHYTRRDPRTGKVSKNLDWVRSVCPWDERRSTNMWKQIQRPVFSNSMLMETVEKVPRLINNPPEESLQSLQNQDLDKSEEAD